MRQTDKPDSYTNPVYGRSFPDPFVIKFKGQYYAYATGDAEDGRIFPMLRSDDLVNWEELPGAMQRLDLEEVQRFLETGGHDEPGGVGQRVRGRTEQCHRER